MSKDQFLDRRHESSTYVHICIYMYTYADTLRTLIPRILHREDHYGHVLLFTGSRFWFKHLQWLCKIFFFRREGQQGRPKDINQRKREKVRRGKWRTHVPDKELEKANVINISSKQLSDSCISALGKGLCFAPTSQWKDFDVYIGLHKFFRTLRIQDLFGPNTFNSVLSSPPYGKTTQWEIIQPNSWPWESEHRKNTR